MTTQQQIETRALRVVDHIVNSRPSEDDLVECKAEWPTDHQKAARQIAALCNTARGEDAMWIIGLREGDNTVPGAGVAELANWWPQVEKYFGDKVAPDIQNMVVTTTYGTVVALNFKTGRTPYLVSTDGHGGVDFEVPLRSSNRTRTAKRHELMLLLSEQVDAPNVELVSGTITARRHSDNAVNINRMGPKLSLPEDVKVGFHASIFVHSLKPVTITNHRSKVVVHLPGSTHPWTFPFIASSLNPGRESDSGIRKLAAGFYFELPDGCAIRKRETFPRDTSDAFMSIDTIPLEIELHFVGRSRPVLVREDLVRVVPEPISTSPDGEELIGTWTWKDKFGL